jgi:hypothetical protein
MTKRKTKNIHLVIQDVSHSKYYERAFLQIGNALSIVGNKHGTKQFLKAQDTGGMHGRRENMHTL